MKPIWDCRVVPAVIPPLGLMKLRIRVVLPLLCRLGWWFLWLVMVPLLQLVG